MDHTLQAHQFRLKNLIITKLKGYGKHSISIFYVDPNHRENILKPGTMQNEGKTTRYVPIFFMLPAILGPTFFYEEKMTWELHSIVKALVDPKYREVKRFVRPIFE